MRMAHTIRLGAWLLVGLNVIMALGTIEIFMRMAPAITVIIDRNERSLKACEDMLAAMVLAIDANAATTAGKTESFTEAFDRAQKNVTESEEPGVLAAIGANFPAAFACDTEARRKTVAAIAELGRINREAMIAADSRARQLGQAGAWGVVFMAVSIFIIGLIFIRSLTRRIINPLEEIHAVLQAHRNRDSLRRCTGADLSQDMREIFAGINEILDHCQTRTHASQAFPDDQHQAGLHR